MEHVLERFKGANILNIPSGEETYTDVSWCASKQSFKFILFHKYSKRVSNCKINIKVWGKEMSEVSVQSTH